MATNNNSTSTTSNPATPAAPPKRKAPARKTPGAPAPAAAKPKATRKAAPAGPSAPTEILFREEPNPHLQPVPPYIWIDHPQEGERLYAAHYVMRLGVGGAEAVEISINQGPWQPCRLTSGYWWYDWSAIPKGKHALVARMRTSGGQWYKTPPRRVEY